MMHAGSSVVNDLSFGYKGERYIFIDHHLPRKKNSMADYANELVRKEEKIANIDDFLKEMLSSDKNKRKNL